MKAQHLLWTVALVSLCACGGSNGSSSSGGASGIPNLTADRIFLGGPILTVNPPGEAQALAVKDGRILAVGTREAVLATQSTSTEIVDLQGKTLMPGFVEPHLHVASVASSLSQVDLLSEAPNQQLSTVLTRLTQALPASGWLQASGFDPSRTSPLFASLTVTNLDSVSSTVPIFVLNASEHIAYVNSAAFIAAGVTNTTANPAGGEYVHDSNGNLTGQINEPPSFTAFEAKFPKRTPAQILEGMRQSLFIFSRAGVTTAGDLNTGLAYGLENEISMLTTLSQESPTPVRVFSYLSFLAMKPGQPLPVQPRQGNDMLRFLGVKFTLDGSTQGFTGALNQPYLTNTTSTGTLDYPNTEILFQDALPFAQDGWQLSFHTNGDRALDQALEVHARLRAKPIDIRDRRFRIEHLTVTSETQLDRLKELDLTPSMTPGHIFYWGQVFFQSILGPERASRVDACASLKSRGIRFSLNSDATTTTVEPLRYIQNVVTRIPQLTPPAVLGPDQRISVDDAIRAVTLDAAYQLFMDDKIGSLEVGKLADLVVLSDNPRTVDPSTIRSIRVERTYLGGVRKL